MLDLGIHGLDFVLGERHRWSAFVNEAVHDLKGTSERNSAWDVACGEYLVSTRLNRNALASKYFDRY